MNKLSPFGVLLIGKFGLWFPLGLLAAVVVAIAQNARRS